ncbi:IS66 family transposase [Niveispirillum cyanobacteriorum]|uniref:IS66 family transposase n=1 Tax=Niveispirillum cyanobacteriorum TaxID=1612173 RepID=A0A2K9NL46_9PROT|nr:IS66 family transposase [Niveispirillum cyanobacteriorum]AUN33792.1 IS66 family transposase [Niveispirillum cyanobacteriorum]GGE82804.1 hypothetical protein GCM10011317_45050 [Niveispirillum cyanobacteriorum]
MPAPDSANDNQDATVAGGSGRRPARRNVGALPKDLPRIERVIEPEVTACPCCGGGLHRIGEDVSEALDIIPAIIRVLRTVRPKYGCRACEGKIVQAPAPARVVTGGMASTALVAHVVTARYAWHLPLYRQCQMLAGQGIRLDRATLAHWIRRAAWWLRPLYEKLLAHIRARPVVFYDETPLPRLDPGRGRTKTCQLWACAVDERPWQGPSAPGVAYVYAEGRQTAEVERQLARFSGILQVDGYQAYKALAKADRPAGPVRLAYCMAHARRKFVDAYTTTKSQVAREVIARIGSLYAIEERITGHPPEIRRAVRQAEAKPILEALRPYLLAVQAQISAQAGLAGAIGYMLNHWEGLCAYLADGRIAIDSNVVERSMRPIGIGRRNSLFAGSAAGGERWAVLASLMSTAKLNGIDPQTYLHDVLERMVSGEVTINRLEELLPWAWKAARNGVLLEHAA